ncbi:DgyrCDS7335 [Dimorphilus gyrociliatus]|uniref:(S)-2-hydroxy-acid oxidase n=1 Tax=Dimorphilus gyrociliatus TaxID=2664684 RepID=A0A7I8VQQ3_9ANNE|nr:DgyrCDS7335 [Dimorphilus gyrociliatus]
MNDLVCLDDIEKLALIKLENSRYKDYLISGAEDENVLERNSKRLKEIYLSPRICVDVSNVSLNTKLLGEKCSVPIGIAPSLAHKLVCKNGELSTANGAEQSDVIYTMSTFSSTRIEDVAAQNPKLIKWYQVYVFKNREITKQAIQRAEKAGYKAIVLTVDAAVAGLRRKLLKKPLSFQQDFSLPNFPKNLDKSPSSGLPFGSQITSTLSWGDVDWLRTITKLPIIMKGVATVEDIILSKRHGASAIWISNHGGRQLDDVPASIDVLAKIGRTAKALELELYVDGGFRKGSDVFKAIALGADAVFIGKPILYALTIGEEHCVKKLFDIMKTELATVMALCGVRNVNEISKKYLWENISRL